MKTKEDIIALLDFFQASEDKPINFDEEAIVSAYHKDSESQSLAIKVLSVFGGVLASLAFLGFLFLAGLYNSDIALLIFGAIFILGSILLNKKNDKIIIDTVSVSSYIIGFILIGFGCVQLKVSTNIISISFILIALASLSLIQKYILSFVSVLIINGSIIALILSYKGYDFIPIYVSALALSLTYIFLKEAKIITTKNALYKLYYPVKIGLIFSFLSGLSLLSKMSIAPISPVLIWFTFIVLMLVIIYLISTLFKIFNITDTKQKISIYIFIVLVMLPTALSPAISGSILIILLSFMVNYRLGLVLGIISFIYFVSQYYYDLNYTLLTKSILLFSTGVLFITLYLFTHKRLTPNEKV